MYTLYIKTGCPYCAKVLKAAEELHLTLELKERTAPGVLPELMARGGKRQVPYFVDHDNKVEMYESDDIVDYLRRASASKQTP
jgi:glutathione S-transferase